MLLGSVCPWRLHRPSLNHNGNWAKTTKMVIEFAIELETAHHSFIRSLKYCCKSIKNNLLRHTCYSFDAFDLFASQSLHGVSQNNRLFTTPVRPNY